MELTLWLLSALGIAACVALLAIYGWWVERQIDAYLLDFDA